MTIEVVNAAHATHHIVWGDASAWLTRHGIDPKHVVSAEIRIDGRPLQAWLDVTWIKTDADGRPCINADRDDVVYGCSSVPLTSWPPLTPIEADG